MGINASRSLYRTNYKLLSIYTLIIFPTRFQQQIKLVQIHIRQAKASADTLVGNEPVIVQIIHQVCDLREAFAFHNDKSTDHSFFREASPPGCRSGQREVQTAEKLVVEVCGSLGCEQRDILNDFLPVDSGQPLSGWCVSQIHFTRMGRRFLYQWSDFRLQP